MTRSELARLSFPPEMEARFVAMSGESRLTHFFISGMISLAVFNGFLIADWWLMPDVFLLDLSMRVVVTLTYSAFALWLMYTRRDFCLKQPTWFIEGVVVLTGLFAAVTWPW